MFLKVLAPLLTGAGSLLLAWRVKTILDDLILAQLGAEANFRSIGQALNNPGRAVPLVVGLDEHVARSQRVGIWLLVIGFLLIAAGGFLSAYVVWFGS